MAEEILESIKVKVTKKGVVVENDQHLDELERRGYGEQDGKKYLLTDYEALYLGYIGRLEAYSRGKKLSIGDLVKRSLGKDRNAWTRFLIYRDLRSRGYVVKDGFGFNVDFRVYERGEFNVKPAKYVVFGLNEGTEMMVKELAEAVKQIMRMGKEPVVAVIERRGEVIYYKVTRTRFQHPS